MGQPMSVENREVVLNVIKLDKEESEVPTKENIRKVIKEDEVT